MSLPEPPDTSSSVPSLSKRHYAAGRQCLKRLWLQVFASAVGQGGDLIANGAEDVGRAARALVPSRTWLELGVARSPATSGYRVRRQGQLAGR